MQRHLRSLRRSLIGGVALASTALIGLPSVVDLGWGGTSGVPGTQTPQAVRSGETETDAEVRARVEKRLLLEDEIAWSNLVVDVTDGEVTLDGMVRSQVEKGLATKLAVTVPGVKVLNNRLIVNANLPASPDDRNVHIERQDRDRVLEGQPGTKDKQILP
ncbi:hypothetical protein YTPLAS18_16160 [Nitrospira sp.]|nr:hypothetical protein YTPLAS18_16160 [Nitrospira sp.]